VGLLIFLGGIVFGQTVLRGLANGWREWSKPRPIGGSTTPVNPDSSNTPGNSPVPSLVTVEESAARSAIESAYARRDEAYGREDVDAFFQPCSIYFETIAVDGTRVSAADMKQVYARTFESQSGATQSTFILSFDYQSSSEAVAEVRTTFTYPDSIGTSQTSDSTFSDRWMNVLGTWLLRERRVLSVNRPPGSSTSP
jgi:hypothetical protein